MFYPRPVNLSLKSRIVTIMLRECSCCARARRRLTAHATASAVRTATLRMTQKSSWLLDLLRLAACVSLFLLIDHGPTDFFPSAQPPSPQAVKATVDCGEVSNNCVHERLAALPPRSSSPPAGLFVLHAGEWPAHTAQFVQSVAAAGSSGALTTYFVSAARPPLGGCSGTSCVWLPVSPEMLGLRVARMLGVPQNALQHDAPPNASWVATKLRDDLQIFAPALFPTVASRHGWVGYIRLELRIHGNLSADIRALDRGQHKFNALLHLDNGDLAAVGAGGAPQQGSSARPPPPSQVPAKPSAMPAGAAKRGGPSDFWLVRNEPNLVQAWRHSRIWRQVLQSREPLGFNIDAARGGGGGRSGGPNIEGQSMATVAGVVSQLVGAGRLHPKQLPDGRLTCCLGASSSPRRAMRRGAPEGVAA